jgi:hypothetical protein
MRIMTSARLRAVGILLLEAAGVALLVIQHINQDAGLKSSVGGLIKKARTL